MNIWRMGTTVYALCKMPYVSASDADDTTFLSILYPMSTVIFGCCCRAFLIYYLV